MKYGFRALLLFFAMVAGAAAQEPTPGPWSGKVGLGYLASSGNTDTTSLSFVAGAAYKRDKWEHEFGLGANSASTDGVTEAERYKASAKSRYLLTERSFVFGALNYEEDRFSGFDRQVSETVGYGRRIIDNERQKLNLELGAGAKQTDLSDGTSQSDSIVRFGGDYLWQIAEGSQFSQTLVLESGGGNTYTEAVTALKTAIAQSVALALSFTFKNNSEVPAGAENTDTFTAITLEYAFP